MEATNEALFQIQRFNILSCAKAGFSNCGLTSSYIYAWDVSIYPAFHENAEWHKPFEQQFAVKKDQVIDLGIYLDEKWSSKKTVTFYDLEDHYKIRDSISDWDRGSLIATCQYMYLNSMFDKSFWEGVIKAGDCPAEAQTISYEYNEQELYLL